MLKQLSVNERFGTLRKLKFCFCCSNSHLMKECESKRVCGESGCTNIRFCIWTLPKQKRTRNLKNPCLKTGPAVTLLLLTAGGGGFLQLTPISIGKQKSVEMIGVSDTGSTVSFVDQTLVDLLKLKGKESVYNINWNSWAIRYENRNC